MKPTNKSLNISFDFKLNPNPSPSPAKSVFSHSNHHLPPTNHQTHKTTHAPKLSLRFGYYDMSESVRICSSSRPINASYSSPKLSPRFFDSFSFSFTSRFSFSSLSTIRRFRTTLPVLKQQGSLEEDLDDSPVSVELQPITSDAQFERVIADAKQLQEAVVIVWMATWCRKCIYIKPKLEKLAAEYYPRLRFYCVDVNTVPYKLVAHAGVTRMPTIQLWRDGEKQAEVIGGHKAYLVINEIREIIENECTV